jgi:hypothetical protein
VHVDVTFSENVTPSSLAATIPVTIGGTTTYTAAYASQPSGANNTLRFTKTIAATGSGETGALSTPLNPTITLTGGTLTDTSGNTATLTSTLAAGSSGYTVDTTAPTGTVATLSTTDTTPALSGTITEAGAAPTLTVTVNGVTYTTGITVGGTAPNYTWTLADNTITPALAVGTHNVTLTITDAAGNVGNDSTNNELTIMTLVTSGLVLNLDAGNPASYPGSGTTWSDLSVSANNGTLTNGPTYSAADGGGSIGFDGTNDGVGLSSEYGTTNNFSVELWVLPAAIHQIDAENTAGYDGTAGQKYIIGAAQKGSNSGFGLSIGTNGVSVYEHGNNYMPCLLAQSTTITSFTHVLIVYTNKKPSLYLNGQWVKDGLTSPKALVYLSAQFIGSSPHYNGKLASLRYYNRSLTAAEIKQNFNAQNDRFGLADIP